MDDAVCMRRGERRGDLRRNLARLVDGERAALEHRGQRLALDVLHDEAGGASVFGDVVEGAYVRVVERGDHPAFALESAPKPVVRREVGTDDLDRDHAAEPAVARAEHLSHAAAPELRLEPVRANLIAGSEGLTHEG